MASPYLERPKRELRQALSELGHIPEDYGMQLDALIKPVSISPSTHTKSISSSKHLWSVMSVVVIVFGAVVVSALLWQQHQEQIAMEEQADFLQDIMPAAGGGDDAAVTPLHPY